MGKGRYAGTRYKNLIYEMLMSNETYDDLAAVCGTDRYMIGHKMRGRSQFTVPQANALCVHFNKPFEYLFATNNV